VDYEQITAPLHGSVTRQIHAGILKKRRQALGLEPIEQGFSLPGIINPVEMAQRELEGGTVLVGRHTLKEYMEGLRRGWTGGVDEWDWEKSVEQELKYDGVFEKAPEPVTEFAAEGENTVAPQQPAALPGTFSFLAKAPPPMASSTPSSQTAIPSSYHIPPYPLPPQAPILLLPFISHLGFKQVPYMVYDFFTERYRVQAGADAAIALIESQTRPLVYSDLEFDRNSEKYYKKDWVKLPTKTQEAREEYYKKLEPRLESVRQLARGERDLTDEEKKSDKPVTTEQDLIEERKKKEMRWKGQEEGFEIVRTDKEVTWDEKWEGWLNVFELPKDGESKWDQ
jgi:import inner membrane translocase subunit TIM54